MNNGHNFNVDSIIESKEDKENEKILLQPFTYILQVPGKMIRSKLAQAFNFWLRIPDEKIHIISEIIMMLHNSSLLIDDIQDNSVLRRGIPVAHSIYGVASTINSANYVYFLGLEKVLSLNQPLATQIYCEQLIELHKGQGMEIYWRDSYICPTEEEYRKFIVRKTGGLFGLAIKLMQLFSESTQNFMPLTNILGLYFQIRDDYANLCMKEYSDSKSFCEDLTEGKFSFPIIHAIQTRPDDKQVINILRQRPKDLHVKKYCISLLDRFGSLEYTRQTLNDLDKLARDEVSALGGNPLIEMVLDSLKNWETL